MLYGLTTIISSITSACPDTNTNECQTGIPKVTATSSEVHVVLQIVFGIIAAIAVLIIVISAFRLVISQGNPEQVKKAREAILASVVGLVIALSAEIIVGFVLGKL